VRKHQRTEDRRRRAYARVLDPGFSNGGLDGADGRADAATLGPAVAAALARLQPADRDALLPLALTDLDYEGITVAMGVPVGTESSPAPDRARAALLAQIATATGPPARRPRVGRRLPLHPSIGLAVAVATTVAAVVIAAGLRGGVAKPASAAAAVLDRAALTAQTSGGPRELRAGEYWYEHSREIVNGAQFADTDHHRGGLVIVDAVTVYDRQSWMGPDKRGLVKQRFVAVRFLSRAARRQWVHAGRPPASSAPLDIPLPADPFNAPYKQLLALPTNVDALYTVIEHRAGKGTPSWRRGAVWQRMRCSP
jgi:hypothetical protein